MKLWILTIVVLAVLKLLGVIRLSWLLILLAPCLISVIIGVAAFVIGLLCTYYGIEFFDD